MLERINEIKKQANQLYTAEAIFRRGVFPSDYEKFLKAIEAHFEQQYVLYQKEKEREENLSQYERVHDSGYSSAQIYEALRGLKLPSMESSLGRQTILNLTDYLRDQLKIAEQREKNERDSKLNRLARIRKNAWRTVTGLVVGGTAITLGQMYVDTRDLENVNGELYRDPSYSRYLTLDQTKKDIDDSKYYLRSGLFFSGNPSKVSIRLKEIERNLVHDADLTTSYNGVQGMLDVGGKINIRSLRRKFLLEINLSLLMG